MNVNINEDFYYNPNNLLSYNCLINLIEGERGNGKTYAFKKLGIDNFIKNGSQFIWIRRYETELDNIDRFFDDIRKRYPNHELEVKGKKFYCDGKTMGMAVPLSKAVTLKSVPFPEVKYIFFDEFLISSPHYHYLKDEISQLFDFYSTVARNRDVRLFLIANSISEINPYHSFFNIKIDNDRRFYKIGKDIILERTSTENYRQAMSMTRFGKIIKNTRYGRYAIDNEYLNDNKSFIEKKSEKAINRFNIVYNEKTIGIWIDTELGRIYCSNKFNSSCPNYCITTKDMQPNYIILKNNSHYIKMLKDAFQRGYIYYENIKIKGIMEEVQKYLYIK